MLTPLDIALNASALLLFPLVLYSLWTGSKAPAGTWAERYSEAEPRLIFVGNLFLLLVCLSAFANLANAAGLIGVQVKDTIVHVLAVPFLILVVAYLRLILRAWRQVRAGR